MEDKIEVQIDCTQGKYSNKVYRDNDNCYLAQALKAKGYTNVAVGVMVIVGSMTYFINLRILIVWRYQRLLRTKRFYISPYTK